MRLIAKIPIIINGTYICGAGDEMAVPHFIKKIESAGYVRMVEEAESVVTTEQTQPPKPKIRRHR